MKKFLFMALVAALTGCANQQFEIRPSSNASSSYDDAQTFWVGGIGQAQDVDASAVCGSAKKVARVEAQQTAGNVGLTILTLGIYSPRQIRVYCTQ